MDEKSVWSKVIRWANAIGQAVISLLEVVAETVGRNPDVDAHTRVTFRAITDAVIPETPSLDAEIGPEHIPGGLEIDLDDFLITYVDDGYQLGLPHVGPHGNIPLADPIAHALDFAALSLVDQGENESELSAKRPVSLLGPDERSSTDIKDAAGAFAKLSRRDRLRAISILDELEFKIQSGAADLFEFDAGLVGQLVVGFTEMIYYSEWQGYDEFVEPPSLRTHPNDPSAVQSWRQTGYPGFADGYAVLRGYLGTDESTLGAGETWDTIDGDTSPSVLITRESGTFRENDYDTSGYEELYPE